MRIYLDTCCLNRPFDDQTQERIRLESEAVLVVLAHIEKGDWEWFGSDVLLDEIEQMPDALKQARVKLLVGFAKQRISVGDKEAQRARELQQLGFQVFDALHLACAESARVDVFLSTDDRLLKTARRIPGRLQVWVENPLVWIEEVTR